MPTPFGGTTYDVAAVIATVSGVPGVLISGAGQRFVALNAATDAPSARLTGLTDQNGSTIASNVIVVDSTAHIPRFNTADDRLTVYLQLVTATDDPIGAPQQIPAANLTSKVSTAQARADAAYTLAQAGGSAVANQALTVAQTASDAAVAAQATANTSLSTAQAQAGAVTQAQTDATSALTASSSSTTAANAATTAANAAAPKTATAGIRTRTTANEAAPTATNWSARPTGYGIVIAVGALPTPSDAAATDLHLIPQG